MTRSERETHLFTRREFLNIFSGHLEVVSRKWDRETTEEFAIYDTDTKFNAKLMMPFLLAMDLMI